MKTIMLYLSFVVFLTGQNVLSKAGEANKTEKGKNYIKVFPNPSPNGKVHVISMEPGVLHLYVFDAAGTLTNQVLLNHKSKQTITGLDKGEYLYDVFKNEESIEQGRIVVK